MSIGIGPAGFGMGVAARSMKRDIAVVAGGLTAVGLMGGAGALALRSTFGGGHQASEPRDGAKLIGEPVPKASKEAPPSAALENPPTTTTTIPTIPEPSARSASAASIRDAAIEAAASQVGEREVSTNRSPAIDRYWDSVKGPDIKDEYRLWSAAFTSWVFNEAGAPLVDRDGSLKIAEIIDWAKEHDTYTPAGAMGKAVPAITGAHRPGPIEGSIVVFSNGSTRIGSRQIGIVEDYDSTTRTLSVISGNVRDAVRRADISLDDPNIEGFIDAAAAHVRAGTVDVPMPLLGDPNADADLGPVEPT